MQDERSYRHRQADRDREADHWRERPYRPGPDARDRADRPQGWQDEPGAPGAYPTTGRDRAEGNGYWRDEDPRALVHHGVGYGGLDSKRSPYPFRGRRDHDIDRDGAYGEDRGFFEKAADEVQSWFGDDEAERRRQMDHRGRGPRNYARSDARIAEDVNDALTDDPELDASGIEVTVTDREVTLSGTVDSRFAKRRAEDCADRVSGVDHVQNNLRVRIAGDDPNVA